MTFPTRLPPLPRLPRIPRRGRAAAAVALALAIALAAAPPPAHPPTPGRHEFVLAVELRNAPTGTNGRDAALRMVEKIAPKVARSEVDIRGVALSDTTCARDVSCDIVVFEQAMEEDPADGVHARLRLRAPTVGHRRGHDAIEVPLDASWPCQDVQNPHRSLDWILCRSTLSARLISELNTHYQAYHGPGAGDPR